MERGDNTETESSVQGTQEESLTEEILIERAKLSSSGFSRDSKSSASSESSYRDQLPLNEEILISNAVLVRSMSQKTASTATVETDTAEGYADDDVFDQNGDNQAKQQEQTSEIRTNSISDVTNNNIPDIKVVDVDEEDAELDIELRDKLQDSLSENRPKVVPRLNIEGLEETASGCRTPVNSEGEMSNDNNIGEIATETVTADVCPGTSENHTQNEDAKPKHQIVEEDKGPGNSIEEEPSDVDFNELIIDIANAISAHEFESIKTAVKGLDCVTEQDLIQLTTPLTYLNHLRRYSLISRDNLSHLQTIVSLLNRPEIQQKAMQYVQHKFDVVFFYPAKESHVLPTSYVTVKCHVKGRDFTRLKRSELESIRTGIANQLFIPSHFVYIVGIEPGFSVIVTFMMHKRYVGLLEVSLSENMAQMAKLGIDAVQIRDRTFAFDNTNSTEGDETDYNSTAFLSVFHQLKEKNKQIGEKDEEIVRLSEETELMQLELDTMSAELEILTERALQESVTLRKQPKRERRYNRHTRSFSEPSRELTRQGNDDVLYFWDIWVKPTTTSGFDVDRSLKDLANDIKVLDNGNPNPTDLNISTSDLSKDKDTLMSEIELLLKELGAKDL